jgi:tetratricopeptide (TPR) repeat protein
MHFKKLDEIAHKPPVVLIALLLIAIVAFAAVHRLVNRFQSRQKVLAAQTFYRGLDEQRKQDFETAIADFRAALSYDPDNYAYELSLTRALVASQHYDEAEAYLASLAERMPQDGDVNLQLARLAVHDNKYEDAVRYYHRAIYGLWSSDPDTNRRHARLELVDFLLDHGQRMEAQSELIASAAGLPPDPQLHLAVADRFLRAQDYQDALDQYREVIQLDRNNSAAHLGAGKAAFQLGEYRTAQRYLQAAAGGSVQDADAQLMLKTTELVLAADPLRPNLPPAERRRRIAAAFQQAGERATQCLESQSIDQNSAATAADPLLRLRARWVGLEPKMRHDARSADASALDDAMETAIQIEQAAQVRCGQPQGLDLALLLIARNREGAER